MTSPGIQIATDSPLARLLVVNNPLDRLQASSKQTERVIIHVALQREVRERGYHGVVDRDPQLDIDIDFSDDDGFAFASPLIGPEGNRVYQWRARLGQLQAEPLLNGLTLRWSLPVGWEFTDNLPAITHEELVSNPTVVTRTMRSPANPQPAAFQLDIEDLFR